jgi:uncharacterized phage-like protein YoqJ
MIIAFTGHRPDKLGGYKLPNPTYIKVCREIDSLLRELRPDNIITGMALGIDQWAASVAHKLGIPFVAAIPFEGQEKAWPLKSQRTYRLLRRLAVEEVIVCEGEYAPAKMRLRNRWMVDNCDALIAVWNGSSGGTGNCVQYANSVNKKIYRIDPTIL